MAATGAATGTVPVLVLKEGTGRTRGKTAQRNNIMAAKIIGEVLRSTLGPRGMDKMLVDSLGDVTVTNDGATILKEIDVQHPAAKMLVEAAKTQDNVVGDGTTSVVIFASELLRKAEELLDQNIHPTLVVSGYRKAAQKALEELNQLAKEIKREDRETLRKVASTAVRSKAIASAREKIIDMAIKAVKTIAEQRGDKWVADVDLIQITKKAGGSFADTRLINGLIIDKEVVHAGMPKRIEKAKIALLECPLEIEKTEISAEIRIRDPTQMKAFLDEEAKMLKEMVDKIRKAGANVVFCQKGIDDMAQHFLAKQGVLAARRIKKSDMEKLARATGGRIVTNIDDLTGKDLGEAELVEERRIGDDKMIFVEGCKNPKSVGILIRGGFERFVDEAERGIHDALSVIADVYEDPKIVPGGGAIEAELSKRLRTYAAKVGGREQLAIEAFADSIEVIPKALAENAGLDPIDIMVDMRAKHEKPNGLGWGVDVFAGKTADMWRQGVIEPKSVKEQAVKSAVEAAAMILRIDDLIAAAKMKTETKGGGGPSPGEMPY
ncbi:MAG: thermosome subunit [Candidatus Hecatellales archaeon B24]|nr:MAG: thermosome subunit [Candidatus Hecatellales archaeon B24]